MINQEKLDREINKAKVSGIEFEVIIRNPGESLEESMKKLLGVSIIRDDLMDIGLMGRKR